HGLKSEVGGEVPGEIQLYGPIDGSEAGIFPGIFTENHLHAAVDGVGLSRSGHVLHVNSAVDVIDGIVAGYVLHLNTAAIDGPQFEFDVAWDLELKIHADLISIVVM